jgi:enediyne biosynthesis protein E4
MKLMYSTVLLGAVIFLSCNNNKTAQTENPVFTKLSSDQSGVKFINTVANTKDFNIFTYRNYYNGGGVAIGDINNDGLSDVFFTANMGENKLYLNKGNLKFEDISQKAEITSKDAWSTGVVMVDINHDNLLDIYVCNAGFKNNVVPHNELFINNGDLTFTEKGKDYGLYESG